MDPRSLGALCCIGHVCVPQVYTMVAHVITEQTSMMYGRHLDQVILCALYGVCKVNQLRQITFKDIITHYKKQAQAKNSIFRTVAIRLQPDLSVRHPLGSPLSSTRTMLCSVKASAEPLKPVLLALKILAVKVALLRLPAPPPPCCAV